MITKRIILTIDLEDWFHSLDTDSAHWGSYERRIEYGTNLLLNFLEEKKSTATFFILGDVAKNHPELIKKIDLEGHEIGSHGYNHEFIYKLTRNKFKNDIISSINLLADLTGKSIVSYRAPYFSITKESLWALEILAAEGIKIDSSIFPVLNHRYGIPGNKRLPYQLSNGIWEFPITTYHTYLGNIPFAGGAYFRFLPLPVTKFLFSVLLKRNEPILTYFHPWEFDYTQPRLKSSSWFLNLRHYYRLENNFAKFSSFVDGIKTISLIDAVKEFG